MTERALQEDPPVVETPLDSPRAGREGAHDSRLIGASRAIEDIRSLLAKISTSPASTVLLRGESGTGKGLIAHEIHRQSARGAGPFLNITCSALPDSLLESELFGYEAGAFTDARQQKKGLLELAHGGTVFLDEIGELQPLLQVKLLRFLEERTFRRVGGTRDLRVDVRVVAATNRDLEAAVRDGGFRQDLYYRLGVVPVWVPPLRERLEDVPLLVRHFVAMFNRQLGVRKRGVLPDALERLVEYGWPGNVRELRNAVERAVLLGDGDFLAARDFAFLLETAPPALFFELPAAGLDFNQLERDLVCQALRRARGNRTRAARLLGWSRHQMRNRIEKFGLPLEGQG